MQASECAPRQDCCISYLNVKERTEAVTGPTSIALTLTLMALNLSLTLTLMALDLSLTLTLMALDLSLTLDLMALNLSLTPYWSLPCLGLGLCHG